MPLSVEFQSLISRSAWSADLSKEQLDRVQKDGFERSYPAGAVVCPQGSPPEHWLGVIDGFVKVDTVSKAGHSTTLAGVPSGSWFGEGTILKDARRPYSVVALRDSKVGFIKASARVAFCLSELFNPELYGTPELTLCLSQEEIGRLSGLSRQNTNRALRELADAGLMMIEYGSVRILDLKGLREFSHPED